MRLLHTADWHLGKVLKGLPRLDEQAAVLAELVSIAAAEAVDLVVVAGDVFESAAPSPEAQRLAWSTLLALRATGAEVVVIAGNHDSAAAFDAVAPVFSAAGVTVLGRPVPPEAGGVVTLVARSTGEPVRLALVPFLSQRGVVRAGELFELDAAESNGAYAAAYSALVARLTAGFRSDAVNIVVAHATLVDGRLGGGERAAQTIFSYAVDAQVFPTSAAYVALGHLHRQQVAPGGRPVWYSGSPLAVDFGEGDDVKGVLVVEASMGVPARVRPVPLASACRLRTVEGTLAELAALAPEARDDLVRVVVHEPARVGLADEVRALLPGALEVTVARPPAEGAAHPAPTPGRDPNALFADYLTTLGVADHRLQALFAELLDAELASAGSPEGGQDAA